MTSLSELIETFVATKASEGKSAKTTAWYQNMLSRFVSYVGTEATLADLTLKNARAFTAHLMALDERYSDHPISPAKAGKLSTYTIHGYVRSLKVFAAWLHEEGVLASDPLARLKRPKLPETIIEVLTEEEIGRILVETKPISFMSARLNTMFLVLLDTGIRATELLTLTVSNLDLPHSEMKVKGKGNKERVVPFGPTTKKALLMWTVRYHHEGCPLVFHGIDGEALTYTALAHLLKRLGEKADVERLHCHLVRHSFAVRWLVNGGDVMSLKSMLGHQDITTSQLYVHLASKDVQIKHQMASPVENLKRKK